MTDDLFARAKVEITHLRQDGHWIAAALIDDLVTAIQNGCEESNERGDIIAAGLIAFQLTREYVGENLLPAIEGWSWFDWCQRAEQFLSKGTEPSES